MDVLAPALALNLAVQWAAFAVSAALRTEHLYDLVGSLGYVLTTLYTYRASTGGPPAGRHTAPGGVDHVADHLHRAAPAV